MKNFRTRIVSRIKSFEDIDGVTVTPRNEKKQSMLSLKYTDLSQFYIRMVK